MKKLTSILMVFWVTCFVYTQTPNIFNYQAVIRNSDGSLLTNTYVRIRSVIIQNNVNGPAVCTEEFVVATNNYGLVNLQIGSVGPNDFATIDWSDGPYFIKIEIDPAGGTDFTEVSTTQLLSVPYSIHAGSVENAFDGQYSSLTGTPDLGNYDNDITDDFNGDYNNLSNLPDLSIYRTTDTTLDESEVDAYVSNNGYLTNQDIAGFDTDVTDDFNGDYNNLSNTPDILDSVMAVLDTSSQFLRSETDASVTNEIQNLQEVLVQNNSAAGLNITNLANPVNDLDAANKAYVDQIKNIIYEELLEAGLNGIVKDYEGNTYKTIKIGDQVWMAENLRSRYFADGTSIKCGTGAGNISEYNIPYYFWYDNDSVTNEKRYGALYSWSAAMNGSSTAGAHGVCPSGWHLPSNTDWNEMRDYLGGAGFAGGSLKETGTINWNDPNAGATNESGFTGRPGGYRNYTGMFEQESLYGYFWSSTQASSVNGYFYNLASGNDNVGNGNSNKRFGFSVRCVRD